jgi:lipopolysaccharide export system protein LptA
MPHAPHVDPLEPHVDPLETPSVREPRSRGPALARPFAWPVAFALALVMGLGLGLAQDAPPATPGQAQDAPGDTPAEATSESASDPDRRIITIDGSGGTQRGNLRSGPIIYEHPDPQGIRATVSTLTILGNYAELTAPEGTSIARGGERTASFQNGVQVERGRLTATGPTLTYSEATGLGVLAGPAAIVVAPEAEGGDPVTIDANEVAFDVDTDRSTSSGDVRLVNGNQTAESGTLVYEEGRNLGVLRSEGAQATITRTEDDGSAMVITANEIRVLTDEKKLYAVGDVTVVDGSITSTGAVVFFDDDTGIAEVIGAEGAPARAVDADTGATLVTDRIKQDVEYDFFEAIDASVPSAFDASAFTLASEAEGGAGDEPSDEGAAQDGADGE